MHNKNKIKTPLTFDKITKIMTPIILVIFFICVVGFALMGVYNEQQKTINELKYNLQLLNKPCCEENILINRKIANDNFTNFQTICNENQIDIFENNKLSKTKYDLLNYNLLKDISFSYLDFAAFVNLIDENYLIEFGAITKETNFYIYSVSKPDLSELKINGFPKTIYITNKSMVNNLTLSQSTIKINELNEEENTKILNYISVLLNTSQKNIQIESFINQNILTTITTFANKLNATIKFSDTAILFCCKL